MAACSVSARREPSRICELALSLSPSICNTYGIARQSRQSGVLSADRKFSTERSVCALSADLPLSFDHPAAARLRPCLFGFAKMLATGLDASQWISAFLSTGKPPTQSLRKFRYWQNLLRRRYDLGRPLLHAPRTCHEHLDEIHRQSMQCILCRERFAAALRAKRSFEGTARLRHP
jgi:hypothetical protein